MARMSSLVRFGLSLTALLCATFAAPHAASATSLPVDLYLEGDPSIIPFLPVATIDINDAGANTVRFDLTPIVGLKFDNLGLGLASSINKFQLVLTALTADAMSLDTGGWLGFPIKVNFEDKPMTSVSFTLSAPGLDMSDFLILPASTKFTNTNFALRFWFMLPDSEDNDGPIDTTAGHDPMVPEPATLALVAGGVLCSAWRRRRGPSAGAR